MGTIRGALVAAALGLLAAGGASAAPVDDFNRAVEAYNSKDYRGAISGYTTYIRQVPNDAVAFANRGAAYYMLKDYGNAVADYQKSADLDPKYDTLVFLGNSLDYAGRYDDAVRAYQRAINLDPNKPSAFKELGAAQYGHRDYAAAASSYGRAAAIEPDNWEAQRNYGQALVDAEMGDAAVAALLKADSLHGGDLLTLRLLGDAYGLAKRDDDAIAAYDRALAINANDYDTLLNKGNVYYNRKDYAASVPFYQQAVRAAPRNPRPSSYLADSYYEIGRYSDAKTAYEAALILEDGFVDAHKGLARTLNKMGDKDGARAEIAKLRAIDSGAAADLEKQLFP
jgi:tetratricopeptide (TPR) repeat protein